MTSTTESALELLKQDRIGRVRTPRAKREAILDEYERSGMSGAQFAQHLGIKYQTFATWVQKRSREKAGGLVAAREAASVNWLEAAVEGDGEGGPGRSGLVVELHGGARLLADDEHGARLAAALLRHLGVGRC